MILGKTFLEGFPEMKGQGFDTLLEGVLATGVAYRGSEVPTRARRRGNATTSITVYWNFVYTPLLEGASVTGESCAGSR